MSAESSTLEDASKCDRLKKRRHHEEFRQERTFKKAIAKIVNAAGKMTNKRERPTARNKERWLALIQLTPKPKLRSRSLPAEIRFRGFLRWRRSRKYKTEIPPPVGLTGYIEHTPENYRCSTLEDASQYDRLMKRRHHEEFRQERKFKKEIAMIVNAAGKMTKKRERPTARNKERWQALIQHTPKPKLRSRSLPAEIRFRGFLRWRRSRKHKPEIPPPVGLTGYIEHTPENYSWLLDSSGQNRRAHPFVCDLPYRMVNPHNHEFHTKPFDPVKFCSFCTKREYIVRPDLDTTE